MYNEKKVCTANVLHFYYDNYDALHVVLSHPILMAIIKTYYVIVQYLRIPIDCKLKILNNSVGIKNISTRKL